VTIIGYTAVTIGAFALRGWVFMQLWLWFVVETFDLPRLNFGEAMGLSLVAAFLTYQISTASDGKKYGEHIVTSIAWSLLALAFGFLWKQFA